MRSAAARLAAACPTPRGGIVRQAAAPPRGRGRRGTHQGERRSTEPCERAVRLRGTRTRRRKVAGLKGLALRRRTPRRRLPNAARRDRQTGGGPGRGRGWAAAPSRSGEDPSAAAAPSNAGVVEGAHSRAIDFGCLLIRAQSLIFPLPRLFSSQRSFSRKVLYVLSSARIPWKNLLSSVLSFLCPFPS